MLDASTKTWFLSVSIKMMFVILIVFVFYVLLSFSNGSSRISNPNSLFDDVVYGQTAMRRVGADRVWVTRLDSVRRQQLQQLSSAVVDETSGCEMDSELCVISALTSRPGIELVFTQQAPNQLPAGSLWYGGFVDPTTGEVFDRLGRAYSQTAKGRVQLTEYSDL